MLALPTGTKYMSNLYLTAVCISFMRRDFVCKYMTYKTIEHTTVVLIFELRTQLLFVSVQPWYAIIDIKQKCFKSMVEVYRFYWMVIVKCSSVNRAVKGRMIKTEICGKRIELLCSNIFIKEIVLIWLQ